MAQMDALALEAAEEVFGHGVVIGIALAGHALPEGFEWDDEKTIRYTYNNDEFYAFLAERAKTAKALHDWAMQLPPVA